MQDSKNTRDRFSSFAIPPNEVRWNLPINVNEAARFLGVSPQTVYLWLSESRFPTSA
jgi:hypothetical protein